MSSVVRLNRTALSELLRGAQGPVSRDLVIKAQRVTNSAKRRCPVDTSRLRASIRYRMFSDATGLFAMVGSDVEYALFVHEGTRYMAGRPFLTEALLATIGGGEVL